MNNTGHDPYRQAGVDTDKAERLSSWLRNETSTARHAAGETLAGIGGFAALYRPDLHSYREPLLVSCTDGVGTKLKLAAQHSHLATIGIDLVAMCINDLYTCGAQPLFFLDYYGCNTLVEEDFKQVLHGIKQGLQQADCLLLGGETAQLPNFYRRANFELVGFVVGIVERARVRSSAQVQVGDRLIAFPSSGLHCNGFALLHQHAARIEPYLDRLLVPTRIYHEMPKLCSQHAGLHALAHITGGGIAHNLRRVLPAKCRAVLDTQSLPVPAWMLEVASLCGLPTLAAAQLVFNMGVGMIACVAAESEEDLLASATDGVRVGEIVASPQTEVMFK